MTELGFVEGFWDVATDPSCPVFVVAARLRPDATGRRRVVSGRGPTRQAAHASCAMEALERHRAVFTEDVGLIWASARELGESAIDPAALFLVSEAQYAGAPEWNQTVPAEHRIPAAFDDRRVIAWVEAWSHSRHCMRLVPAAACYLGYSRALEERCPCPDSNGLAAGKTVEDATERALLELVERDAVSIWWYSRVRRPAMPLERMASPFLAETRRWLVERRRDFWVLDLTNDLGCPVAVAISCDPQGTDLSFGFAASRDADAAVTGAIGEMVQFEASKLLRRRHEGGQPPDFLTWSRDARVDQHRFLRPSGQDVSGHGGHAAGDRPDISRFGARGIEVVCLDLSADPADGAVVRVLAPGLRPLWPRFAPGRLYDVPVALGWLKRPRTEHELNKVQIIY